MSEFITSQQALFAFFPMLLAIVGLIWKVLNMQYLMRKLEKQVDDLKRRIKKEEPKNDNA